MPIIEPRWVYGVKGGHLDVRLSDQSPDLIVTVRTGSRERLIRLDRKGEPVGSELQLPGVLRSIAPEGQRFLVVAPEQAWVIDSSGRTLWHGETGSGKGAMSVHLLPDGETLVMALLTEMLEGVRTVALDLSGRTLWTLEGAEAGELARASDEELFFWNDHALWRMSWQGEDRKDILVGDQRQGSISISADGSTIALLRETKGRIYDREGRILAELPGGWRADMSRDGRRILVAHGDDSYTMVNREGQPLWNLELSQEPVDTELDPDGSFFVTATPSQDGGRLRVDLYDESGRLVWQSNVSLPSEDRNRVPRVGVSADLGLLYLVTGSQVMAWELSQ
ncbi:MAG: TolB family protein [Bacillota bacterium]